MAPSLVQSKSATGTSGTSLTITLTSATTAGNCLVVGVGAVDNTTNPQVSGITLGGSAGNFAAANTAYNDADCNAAIWVDPSCAGGQTSVVISFTHDSGGSPHVAAWVMEWSGIASASPVDKAPAGSNGSGTSWSSGSTGTLSQASEVAIGVIAIDGIATLTTPGSPWTELTQLTSSPMKTGVGYQVVSATTALTYNGSVSASALYGTCIVTLKATGNVSVALPVAQVTAAAPAPAPAAGPLALPVAQVRINAYPPVPGQVVALPVAQVTAAALPPRLPVILPAAQVTITARPPQPSVNVSVALPAAAVTIAAHPPRVSRQLLISLAAKAGTDDYGTPFPQGLKATAGVIEGPTIIGSDAFYYSGSTPALGTLIASVAQAAGTDSAGNAYLAGSATYGGTAPHLFATSLEGGSVQFWTATSAAGPWSFYGQIEIFPSTPGVLVLDFAEIAGAINTPQASGAPLPLSLPAPASYSALYAGDTAAAVNDIWSALIAAGILSS